MNNGYADFNEQDSIAFASNPAFDASTMEVWGALLNGGQLLVIEHTTLIDPMRFSAALRQCNVSVLFLTTALFNQYVQLIPEALGGCACCFQAESAQTRPASANCLPRHRVCIC